MWLLALACARTTTLDAPLPPPAAVRPQDGADLIYFVMVDRFANGDPSNDGEVDLQDPQAFHGGDLVGIVKQLDYLQGLGVKTLWLSPIFEMRTEKFHEWGAFHGYWVRDPTRVEPRFGDERTLRALSDALEARGMRLVLDMVYNHVSFDSPLLTEHPDWFHPALTIEDWNDPQQLVNRQVHGLPDLDQSNPDLQAYYLDLSLRWAREQGVDGFRIDAVRHLPLDYLRQLSEQLHAALGPEFWLLGEDFQGDAGALSATFAAGGFDALFDFPLRYALVDVYCGARPPGRLAATLSLDRLYADPGALVTFLDNHDLPRITTACHGDRGRVDQAQLFQFMSRGTPALTWGSELYLEGGDEPDNRRDMPTQREGAAWTRRLQEARERYAPGEGTPRVLSLGPTHMTMARIGARGATYLAVNTGSEPIQVQVPPELMAGGAVAEVLVAGAEAAELTPDGALNLPGDSTVAVLIEATGPMGYQTLRSLATQRAASRVSVVFEAPVSPPGGELALVGAGPELGAWDPARALRFAVEGDGVRRARVQVPPDLVLAYKLILVEPNGAVRWQDGDDQNLLVQGDEQVAVAW